MKKYHITFNEEQKNTILASLMIMEHQAKTRNDYTTTIMASSIYQHIATSCREQDRVKTFVTGFEVKE
jgi:hypothetical protein